MHHNWKVHAPQQRSCVLQLRPYAAKQVLKKKKKREEYPDTDHNSQWRSESGELIAMTKMVGKKINKNLKIHK